MRDRVIILDKYITESVLSAIPQQVKSLLLDSVYSAMMINAPEDLSDYSFLIAPAYKALEGYLFFIARELKLPSGKNSDNAGGYFYDAEKVRKAVENIVTDLVDATESWTDEEKQHVASYIHDLQIKYKSFRHHPAHFLSQPIITKQIAHRQVLEIWGLIDQMTQLLLSKNLIPRYA